MKRFLRLIVLLLPLMVCSQVRAEEIPNDEIWYTSTDGNVVTPNKKDVFGASIVSNTYTGGKGIIKFNGNVTSIGSSAFYCCSSLASITIPNSVTSIGSSAFSRCYDLASITIPNSVTSIGSSAFSCCYDLASITIPNSVTSIGDYAFNSCSSLTSVTIGNSVTSIGEYAFGDCNLSFVVIPQSVKTIGINPFLGNENLAIIVVDAENTTFDCRDNCNAIIRKSDNALISGCKNTVIPNSVTNIGRYAFASCSSLSSITIPNSVTSIEDGAFSGCSSLPVIDNIRYADTYLVGAVDKTLSSYTIKEGTKWIGGSAFSNCSSLTSITIPNSVISIGNSAFSGCSSLPVIDNLRYADTYLVEAVDKTLASYTIKEGTKWIGSNAFKDCTHLLAIVIPNSVQTIQSSALFGCSNLKMVLLPSELKTIEYYAFYGCSSLASITIPNSVTSIGSSAFYECYSLTAVHINSLESWCKIKFGNGYANPTTYAHKLYLNDTELQDIVIPSSINTINASAFHNCSNFTSVTVPNSVTSIGNEAFGGCSSLASINIPDLVTNIGSYAFSDCSSLASVTIGNSVTSIGEYAFNNCFSLASVTIPNSVTSIEDGAFSGCYDLASITIPNSVTSIGSSAFYKCYKLSSITIPNSVTSIGSSAFYGCSSLASITIPNSVTSIGSSAFYGCRSLASITIPNSVTSIGSSAFYECYKLSSITNLATMPQKIDASCFYKYSVTLHVYETLKSLYEADAVWGKFNVVDDIPTMKATSITMGASTYFCSLFGYVNPTATVNPEATVKSVTWESSAPSILMILDAATGQSFGLNEGVATITARTTDGSELSASATVYVGTYNPVTAITLNQTSGTLEINKTLTLTATVLPENATAKSVKWTSSNTDIATVSVEGVVTALAPGTVTITATSVDGTNIKATCEITVPEFNVKYTDATGQEICRYLASGDDAAINDAFKRLEVLQPIENVNVTYTRSFDSKMVNNWQAWFMPFDVDYDDMSDAYEVAQIYGVLMDKAGVPYIAFQKMTEGVVLSNVPYAVRVKEAGDAVITTTTTLQQTAKTDSFSVQSTANNFTFGGVYKNSYLSAEYPTYALNKSGNFALMASDVYLRPFRFYMRITDREDNPYKTAVTPAEVKVVVLGEDETSIDEIHNAQFIMHNDESSEIYNLGGQKLLKLQKGINIVNGRKVLF